MQPGGGRPRHVPWFSRRALRGANLQLGAHIIFGGTHQTFLVLFESLGTLEMCGSPRSAVGVLLIVVGVGACGGDGPIAPGNQLASLELSPAETTVVVGSDFQLRILAKDASGLVVGTPVLASSSSVDSIASVTPSGMVAANFVGRATVRVFATGSSISDTSVVHVVPQIIDIPLPAGAIAVQVKGVNDSRTVVGETFHVPVRAFTYTPAGGTRYLAVPDSRGISTAQDVNNAGTIVGGYNATGVGRTLVWDTAGNVTDLGDFRGGTPWGGAVAYAINSSDVILINHSAGSALYELRTGSLTQLGIPTDMDRLESGSLSDDGAVLGLAQRSGIPCKTVIWTRSAGFETLPRCSSLGGIANGKRFVGGYYWDPSLAEPLDIGSLGGTARFLYAINNHGVAVGVSAVPSGMLHAILWTKTGGLVDLGATIPYPSWATAISPGGIVAGVVELADAPQRWKPVLWILRRQ